jgi:putative FmdB family regulatory protein
MRQLGLPFGVVINRANVGDGRVKDYCAIARIPVLLEIPDDRRIAEAYSRGELVIEAVPETRAVFDQLRVRLEESLLAVSSVQEGGGTMPTYEYECEKCGYRFERFQSMSDKPLEQCPRCSGPVQRLIGAGSAVLLKGSRAREMDTGWRDGPRCGRVRPCCGREQPCDAPPCEE